MTRSRWRAPLALTLALVLAVTAAACGDDDKDTDTGAKSDPTIRIAPQDFAEAKTLTEVYAQYLTAKGFDVDLQAPNGFRDQVYPDLEADKLDMIIEYAGSAVAFLDKTKAGTHDPDDTTKALDEVLAAKDLVAFTRAPAEDANALVAVKAFADENGITKISDLAKLGRTVKLGGAEDCRERVDCLKGYTDTYKLTMDFTAVAYGPPLIAALDSGTEDVVQYQTTAAELASGKYVVLEDDLGILSSDNIVPVLRKELADAYGARLEDALEDLTLQIRTEDLIAWNVATDINKEEPADVAKAWLSEKGIL